MKKVEKRRRKGEEEEEKEGEDMVVAKGVIKIVFLFVQAITVDPIT